MLRVIARLLADIGTDNLVRAPHEVTVDTLHLRALVFLVPLT